MNTLCLLVYFLGNIGVSLCTMNYNIEFDRVEGIQGEEETLIENIVRLSRKGKKYLANGTLTYHADLGEDIMHMIKTSYSPDASSKFRSHPYTIQKSTICEFFRTIYIEYGQPWLIGHTNFPVIPKEGLCPLPKGHYWAHNVSIMESGKFPPHCPSGLWKIEQTFEKKGKLVGGLRIYLKVSQKVNG